MDRFLNVLSRYIIGINDDYKNPNRRPQTEHRET